MAKFKWAVAVLDRKQQTEFSRGFRHNIYTEALIESRVVAIPTGFSL